MYYKALVFGSSHARRQGEIIHRPPFMYKRVVDNNFGFNRYETKVKIKGWGGATVRSVTPALTLTPGQPVTNATRVGNELANLMRSFKPHSLTIILGSNDLAKDIDLSPELCAHLICQFARKIILKYDSVKHVAVSEILPRDKVPFTGYNKKVHRTNEYLRKMVKSEKYQDVSISCSKNKGLWKYKPKERYRDGIHLSDKCQYVLYKNIRGSIIHGRNVIRRT